MKKLLYSLLAVGTVAGLASCSSDEPMMSGNSDGKVTIEVKLPDFGTRFYGDQLQCNELIYTIFNADGDVIDGVTDVKQDAFGPGVTSETVKLNLVPGETYMIAFYAHNKGSLFSAYSNGTIDVNYEKMNVNNEIDDAFYCYVPISTTATEPQSVTLNRAFAQINFGTNDFTNPLVQEVIGSLTASFEMEAGETGLYTSLDTKTNAVSVPQTDAITTTNSLTANTDFPVANYGNLTSLYVLVSPEEGQMLGKGTYTLNNGEKVLRTVNMANTPVRMNYRTNIYGAMLTTQIPVTVEIEPNFADVISNPIVEGTEVTPENIAETIKNSTDSDVVLKLTPGTYTTSAITTWKKGVSYTLNGYGEITVLSMSNNPTTNSPVVLNDLSVVVTTANFAGGFQGPSVTYNNCNVTGALFLYAKKATFNKCTLTANNNAYPLWTYGCDNLYMTDCTFVGTDTAKGILVYGPTEEHVTNMTLNKVNFTTAPSATASTKAAVEIHTEKFATCAGGTIILNNCTANSLFGGGLWREILNNSGPDGEETKTQFFTIIENGKTIQEGHPNYVPKED